jgi:hypothetical protein
MSSSWAQQRSITIGKMGDRVTCPSRPKHSAKIHVCTQEIPSTIHICEETRATTYEFRNAGVQVLQKILTDNYLSKGIDGVLYGIASSTNRDTKYAIFLASGFLREVEPD